MKTFNFTSNEATYAGAIYLEGTGNVENCNFVDNKATGYGNFGGAVFFRDKYKNKKSVLG